MPWLFIDISISLDMDRFSVGTLSNSSCEGGYLQVRNRTSSATALVRVDTFRLDTGPSAAALVRGDTFRIGTGPSATALVRVDTFRLDTGHPQQQQLL